MTADIPPISPQLTDDQIIDVRDTLLARGDITMLSVHDQNLFRDCDIALGVVRCPPEAREEARERLLRAVKPTALTQAPRDLNTKTLDTLDVSAELETGSRNIPRLTLIVGLNNEIQLKLDHIDDALRNLLANKLNEILTALPNTRVERVADIVVTRLRLELPELTEIVVEGASKD